MEHFQDRSRSPPRVFSRHPPFSKQALSAQYLILYNLVSAILWVSVLGRVVLLAPIVGFENVYGGVGQFAKWTQTLAVLEIVHSAIGLVRSPLFTTVMQVSSRLLLIWGITNAYPSLTTTSPFYSSMLFAWSVSEIVRYTYFVLNLRFQQGLGNGVPDWLSWARYNLFFGLYPLGIGSEMALVWKVVNAPANKVGAGLKWGLIGVLVGYVPGSYILYTHMMAQRRKVMKGKEPETQAFN